MKYFLIILAVIALFFVGVVIFMHTPAFGKQPSGKRLERIEQSPNYKDGAFHNQYPTVMMTGDNGFLKSLKSFFQRVDNRRPVVSDKVQMPEVVKQDYHNLPDSDCIVWFGHSSYLLQLAGKRFLVDPVFYQGSPVRFVNTAFAGTDVFKPQDMPYIDYLIITHDHWDHLDYWTVKELKDKVGKIIVPLGVGEDFEYWGFPLEQIIELDWYDEVVLTEGFRLHCLPSRHFSGRTLKRNYTLWASFMLESPTHNIFMGGDGGYDKRFAEFGEKFPVIDYAILENGQYNTQWAQIHTLPEQLGKEAFDLKARHVITVHHSKFALANHAWDEPLKNELNAAEQYHLSLLVLTIGEITRLEPQKYHTTENL